MHSLIPETGPYGSFAVLFTPEDITGISDSYGADFLRADGRRIGAMFAGSTTAQFDGEYVTARFVEGDILSRSQRVMAGAVFDVFRVRQADDTIVIAIGFTAYEDDERILIDGNVPYARPSNTASAHVVAWADSEDAAALLIAETIDLVSETQAVGFVSEAPSPIASIEPTIAPNPFVTSTMVTVRLDAASRAKLDVFDVLGRRVATLASVDLDEGNHTFPFVGERLPAGVYTVRLTVNNSTSSRRITKLR